MRRKGLGFMQLPPPTRTSSLVASRSMLTDTNLNAASGQLHAFFLHAQDEAQAHGWHCLQVVLRLGSDEGQGDTGTGETWRGAASKSLPSSCQSLPNISNEININSCKININVICAAD